MQSLIAVIFKEDMDRAEAYRVELRGREELAGLVDCSKMVAAVCDKEGKVHLQYTHALAKDGALIGGVWGALIGSCSSTRCSALSRGPGSARRPARWAISASATAL